MAATCWPIGWPRANSACRARTSSARRRSTCFRRRSPTSSRRTTRRRCDPPTACSWTTHPRKSRAKRFITSKRIGIPDQTGEARYLINVVDDVTERRRADERIAHMAHHDALTDLPNRVLFREQLERALRGPAAASSSPCSFSISTVQGHQRHARPPGRRRAAEDRRRPAARLHPRDRPGRAARRRRVRHRPDRGQRRPRRRRIRRRASARRSRQPYQCLGHQLSTDASIGIALAPHDGTDLRAADQERRPGAVRRQGRRARHLPLLRAGDGRQREGAARAGARPAPGAGRGGEFEIHYQPLVDLAATNRPAARRCCAGAIPSAA